MLFAAALLDGVFFYFFLLLPSCFLLFCVLDLDVAVAVAVVMGGVGCDAPLPEPGSPSAIRVQAQ